MDAVPFKVGDRVRLNAHAQQTWRLRIKAGIVVEALPVDFNGGLIRVKRTRGHPELWDADAWELIPVTELTADQTAQDLADAVKRGETDAALALADHIFELYGATKK